MSQYIKTFKELNCKDVGIAGGKGASLGEMLNAKMPVPPGFVVLASAFDRFLEETDLGIEIAAQLAKINFKDINSIERTSNVIRDLMHDVVMHRDLKKEIESEFDKLKTEFVAVRSSATAEDSAVASWAGELESYLFVAKKNLADFVKKCWSSLFTPRAIFYAFEKKLFITDHQKLVRAKTCKRLGDCYPVSVAVVVQKMVDCEVAGICFTVHPVTEDKNQLVIEAGWGLGEAIVGGKITPDTYVIEKSKFMILDKNISEQKMMIVRDIKGIKEEKVSKLKKDKQKLTDKQIKLLAQICQKIEKHYKIPQDIEWALEKNKFYIVQSRPITTLKK